MCTDKPHADVSKQDCIPSLWMNVSTLVYFTETLYGVFYLNAKLDIFTPLTSIFLSKLYVDYFETVCRQYNVQMIYKRIQTAYHIMFLDLQVWMRLKNTKTKIRC